MKPWLRLFGNSGLAALEKQQVGSDIGAGIRAKGAVGKAQLLSISNSLLERVWQGQNRTSPNQEYSRVPPKIEGTRTECFRI
jgi:hypothetical protein